MITIPIVNESDFQKTNTKDVKRSLIQFHFCVKGGADFIFNNGNYLLPIDQNKVILLFNPEKDLPINLKLNPKSSILSIIISIKKFHSLFSELTDNISFLSQENSGKKYYKENVISPQISTILNQIVNEKISENVKNLYLKGKIFELLGLFFNESNELNIEQCPFLADEKNVVKIKMAKEIIIKRMSDPPSLKELSAEVDISLKNLKEGFKEIYGYTVYGFLLEYKMNIASKMLSTRNYNVNEVADHIGYSTSSHFINAFKNRFGTTPKKYLKSI